MFLVDVNLLGTSYRQLGLHVGIEKYGKCSIRPIGYNTSSSTLSIIFTIILWAEQKCIVFITNFNLLLIPINIIECLWLLRLKFMECQLIFKNNVIRSGKMLALKHYTGL